MCSWIPFNCFYSLSSSNKPPDVIEPLLVQVPVIDLNGSSIDCVQCPVISLHFFFFLLFPLLSLLWCSASPLLWLVGCCFCSLDHSLCSWRSKSGVNSPSLTRRPARELCITSSEPLCPLWPLLLVKWSLLAVPILPRLPPCVFRGSVMFGSMALMRRVMFRTPSWMVSSSIFWISRTKAVSGNMSMKR